MIRCCYVHVRSHKEKDAIVCFFADTRVNVIRCSKYFSPAVFLFICLPKQLPPVKQTNIRRKISALVLTERAHLEKKKAFFETEAYLVSNNLILHGRLVDPAKLQFITCVARC